MHPFPLVMKVGQCRYKCHFQSNFHVLKYGLPRVAVVVDPPPLEDELAEGLPSNRLLLQGASVVRFANTYLDEYKGKRNFVFTYLSTISAKHVALFYIRQGAMTRYARIWSFNPYVKIP